MDSTDSEFQSLSGNPHRGILIGGNPIVVLPHPCSYREIPIRESPGSRKYPLRLPFRTRNVKKQQASIRVSMIFYPFRDPFWAKISRNDIFYKFCTFLPPWRPLWGPGMLRSDLFFYKGFLDSERVDRAPILVNFRIPNLK